MNSKGGVMRRKLQSRSGRRGARGVALIEALIGILIFAFGVLGLMGLQAAMTKAQTAAKIRADATNLASDLFGLIQTDRLANFDKYADANCAAYARCADWLAKVHAALPNARAAVTVNSATGEVYAKIDWQIGNETRNQYETWMVWRQ